MRHSKILSRIAICGTSGATPLNQALNRIAVNRMFIRCLHNRALRRSCDSYLAASHARSNLRSFSTESSADVYEFKAETQKLLQIVAHSLYTDKEVFVRELISNASDALEKLRFLEATKQDVAATKVDADVPYKIKITTDAENKTFTIEDTGVGMSKEEVINNLGTIAKSGSLAFLEDASLNAKDKANAIIGQFGVGFYSSFVVSNKVDVYTRSYDPELGKFGYHWSSDGSGSFTLSQVENLPRGTKIVCHLRDDCLLFSNTQNVKKVAEKFSAFINFPLYIQDGKEEVEITTQKALWIEKDATDEEHEKFFRFLSNTSWGSPMYKFTFHSDAPLSIKSIFYIPEDAPNRMFQSANEVGVSLHSRKVLVKKSADSIVPKWLFFIKGVVDCEDMPLNVSRETMQDTQLIKKLSNTVVARILRFFKDQSKKDPEKFLTFYSKYKYYLKEGVLDEAHSNGSHKDGLLELLRFESSILDPGKLQTLDEYIASAKENQKNIYYFCANNRNVAMASPYMENFKSRGRNVLLLLDDIDEFVAMNIQEYKGKKLVAIDSAEEDFEPELDEAPKSEPSVELAEEDKNKLLDFIKKVMGSRISQVTFSDRLVDSPAVLTGFLSPALRKVMKATMRGGTVGADAGLDSMPCNLEINSKHPIVTALLNTISKDEQIAELLVQQLHDNAAIAAGIIDDPRTMLSRLNKLLETTAQCVANNK